jgi:D-erythrulose 1-phosphate 3-epimerase
MKFPKIYLAIDNCFASKRWTQPFEWMEVISEMGLNYIEASADNECDPLYMGTEYMKDWVKQVKDAEKATGAKVVNLYSGHGTYATLGLAHTDKRIRDRFLKDWLMPMTQTAGELGAGLGFFCHAFSDSVLQDPLKYNEAKEDLYARLSELSSFAADNMQGYIGVEQMYTPHQIPWTIEGTKELVKEVYSRSKNPFYVNIDLGHQSGQYKFRKPDANQLRELISEYRTNGNKLREKWLGPLSAYQEFAEIVTNKTNEEQGVKNLQSILEDYPHMFAEDRDGNTYKWLEKLACYSPIIHLQQTDGRTSGHWPFTAEYNKKGIIDGGKVLKAIYAANSKVRSSEYPSKVDSIYLTIEVFSSTASLNEDIKARIIETVEYWRKFVPNDGENLDTIISRMSD